MEDRRARIFEVDHSKSAHHRERHTMINSKRVRPTCKGNGSGLPTSPPGRKYPKVGSTNACVHVAGDTSTSSIGSSCSLPGVLSPALPPLEPTSPFRLLVLSDVDELASPFDRGLVHALGKRGRKVFLMINGCSGKSSTA